MHRPSGKTLLLTGLPLTLAASLLTVGGFATLHHGPEPGPARSDAAARTASGSARSPQPPSPTLPTLGAVPRQGAAGQPLTSRSATAQPVGFEQISEQALGAYQRAAQVIDSADPACRLSWTLLAAIGQVQSRYGAYGPLLDGSHGRVTVEDSDAGAVDGDPRFDRAVGPMQLLPSTWSQVAVDADGDGRRDPQDIDDAALGAAVFLCGNGEDLGTRQGKRSAVFRYNHARGFVLYVLALSHRYTVSQQALLPLNAAARAVSVAAATDDLGPVAAGSTPHTGLVVKPTGPAATPAAPGGASDVPTPSDPTSPTSPTGTPTPAPDPTPTPTPTPTPDPTPSPTPDPTPSPTPDPTPTPDPPATSPTTPATTP